MGNGRHLRFRRRVLPGHVDAQGNVPEFGIFQPGFPAARREAVHDPGLHDLLISEEFHRRHGFHRTGGNGTRVVSLGTRFQHVAAGIVFPFCSVEDGE